MLYICFIILTGSLPFVVRNLPIIKLTSGIKCRLLSDKRRKGVLVRVISSRVSFGMFSGDYEPQRLDYMPFTAERRPDVFCSFLHQAQGSCFHVVLC